MGKDRFASLRCLGSGRLSLILLLLVCASCGSASSASAACPNDAFRVGPASHLPDCRAYELVTPADSNGRLISNPRASLPFDLFPIELASPMRDSVLFMGLGSPLKETAEPNGVFDLYQAERSSEGWRTIRRLSPSGPQASQPNAGGVSADHQYAFVNVSSEQAPTDNSLYQGEPTTFLGSPDGSFEILGVGSLGTERLSQGRFISPGGHHIIFSTGGIWCELAKSEGGCVRRQLEPDAPPNGTSVVYERGVDGPTRVVSLLPGNITPATGEDAEYQGNSPDGSVIAFSIGSALYVRIDGSTTIKVADGFTEYAGLSGDGSRIFYVDNGDIYGFDIPSGELKTVAATGDAEVVNVSADGSHVYFVSHSILESGAIADEPNLYMWVWSDDPLAFVATVAPEDVEGVPALNTWTSWAVNPHKEQGEGPGANTSRTTPDGGVIVFESRAQLTSNENQGHNEIYRYDAADESLLCISCNPDGAPATAGARLQSQEALNLSNGGAAVVIHNLSIDGSRVFFESKEDLLAADTDGITDIYEWQRPAAGGSGTLGLISSGRSTPFPPLLEGFGYLLRPNTLFAVTPDGSDVVFLSMDPLVAGGAAGGVPALFDARVNGGFPVRQTSSPCQALDQCRGSDVPGFVVPTVSSASLTAQGRKAPPRRCRKGRSGKPAKGTKKRKRCHRRRHNRGGTS